MSLSPIIALTVIVVGSLNVLLGVSVGWMTGETLFGSIFLWVALFLCSGVGVLSGATIAFRFIKQAPATSLDHVENPNGNKTIPSTFDIEIDQSKLQVTQHIREKARFVSEELGHYRFFTELLRKQTTVVTQMTEGASIDILTRLTDVDRRFTSLLEFLDGANSNNRVIEIIDQAESQLGENKKLLENFQELRQREQDEGTDKQTQIRAVTDRLKGMVKSIRDIAYQTNMLAFNASIEAARAGKAGAGFTVVASEVKALSRQSDKVAVGIQREISQLIETINSSLDQIIRGHAEEEEHDLRCISRTVADLTENLEKLISHQRDVLIKVHNESREIAEPIMSLMSSVQFQDITRQQLEMLVQTSETVDAHIESLRNVLLDLEKDIDPESLGQKIDNMYKLYVMAQQRNAHLEAAGSAGRETEGALVELF
ncbi:methyl-accepting chemotaxis protein [Azospirillaceae bacterium]